MRKLSYSFKGFEPASFNEKNYNLAELIEDLPIRTFIPISIKNFAQIVVITNKNVQIL